MPKISRNEHLSPHYIIPHINHHVKHNSQLIHKYLAARAARSLLPSPWRFLDGLRPVGLRLLCAAWLLCLLVVPLRGSRLVCPISRSSLCCRIALLLGLPLRPLRHVPVSCRLDSPACRRLWASRPCSNLILVRDLVPSRFYDMMLLCR